MPTGKTLTAHVVTALVTLSVVLVLFGDRLGTKRLPPAAGESRGRERRCRNRNRPENSFNCRSSRSRRSPPMC